MLLQRVQHEILRIEHTHASAGYTAIYTSQTEQSHLAFT